MLKEVTILAEAKAEHHLRLATQTPEVVAVEPMTVNRRAVAVALVVVQEETVTAVDQEQVGKVTLADRQHRQTSLDAAVAVAQERQAKTATLMARETVVMAVTA